MRTVGLIHPDLVKHVRPFHLGLVRRSFDADELDVRQHPAVGRDRGEGKVSGFPVAQLRRDAEERSLTFEQGFFSFSFCQVAFLLFQA